MYETIICSMVKLCKRVQELKVKPSTHYWTTLIEVKSSILTIFLNRICTQNKVAYKPVKRIHWK